MLWAFSTEKGEQEEEFETWLEKKKEAEEKEREEKQKQQAKLNTPEGGLQRRKNKSDSSSSSSSSSSVMELDEEDAAIVQETKKMGYCYFRRDLTEEEKRLNAQNKPTKIASPTPSPQSAGAAGGEPEKSPEGKSISQWNAKGTTYEEKDVSPWARTRFAERLQEASAECGGSSIASPEALIEVCRKATEAIKDGGLKDETAMKELFKGCLSTKVETTSVGEVSGDAHLAVVRGSRRVFFDMKCSVKFNISCSSGGALGLPPESSALSESLGSYESKGTLTLPDVSSADGSGMSWLQGSSVSLNKAPSPLFKPVVDEALQKYKESIAEKIQAFLDDCKALP
ncbi:hypothetical protein, conserved [Eimeria tenella]|uniref:Activator of Hsp90 ATPase AHSA1-like N-terminal domain-containing protein n=1 Tax=Eimeria tenella TaxID=5802 RepID=U6L0Q0_EIMTE|nr:hypothetical protein, conserved [Eimeria tenella]CDJ42773.1 hypothetical protein, conserved [Eimeria tenella]|eukprot:XP_013233523.1 hypothetical protein, conserved [Eimeria tenella]